MLYVAACYMVVYTILNKEDVIDGVVRVAASLRIKPNILANLIFIFSPILITYLIIRIIIKK